MEPLAQGGGGYSDPEPPPPPATGLGCKVGADLPRRQRGGGGGVTLKGGGGVVNGGGGVGWTVELKLNRTKNWIPTGVGVGGGLRRPSDPLQYITGWAYLQGRKPNNIGYTILGH